MTPNIPSCPVHGELRSVLHRDVGLIWVCQERTCGYIQRPEPRERIPVPRLPGTASGKYHNQPTMRDGMRFDSLGESRRWSDLQQEQHAGVIRNLRRQVRYKLVVNGQQIADYVADFVYQDTRGIEVVEDFKGVRTPEYKLKSRLMTALYGITILETRARQ